MSLGSAIIARLGLDSSEFQKGILSAESSANKWAGKIGGLFAGVFAVSTVVNFFRSAIDEAKKFESIAKTFETILGSRGAAMERMANLSDFAASTPFELEELAVASRTLQTLTKGALATGSGLTLVGDTVAAVNGDFGELSVTIGRVYAGLQSGSRTIGAELNRLVELGVISIETKNKLTEMQEAGIKGAEAWSLVAKELGRFEGAMEGLSETLEGRVSTLNDSISALKRSLAESFVDPLKEGVRYLTQAIEGAQTLDRVFKEKGKVEGTKLAAGSFLESGIGNLPIPAMGMSLKDLGIDGFQNDLGVDESDNPNKLNIDKKLEEQRKHAGEARINKYLESLETKVKSDAAAKAEADAAEDRKRTHAKELSAELSEAERQAEIKAMAPSDRNRTLAAEEAKLTNEYASLAADQDERREEIAKRLKDIKGDLLTVDKEIAAETKKAADEEARAARELASLQNQVAQSKLEASREQMTDEELINSLYSERLSLAEDLQSTDEKTRLEAELRETALDRELATLKRQTAEKEKQRKEKEKEKALTQLNEGPQARSDRRRAERKARRDERVIAAREKQRASDQGENTRNSDIFDRDSPSARKSLDRSKLNDELREAAGTYSDFGAKGGTAGVEAKLDGILNAISGFNMGAKSGS